LPPLIAHSESTLDRQPAVRLSRAQVVLGFSESAEHIAGTAPHVDAGIWLA
jgi:hypothetical protein